MTANGYTGTAGGGGGGAVDSVFGRTGAVVAQSGDYTKAQVGLGNVDNTADVSKSLLATQISNSTATGRSVLTAADTAAARTAIGLGNVDNTADASKSFLATQISNSTATGRSVLTAADAAAARTAIGAGTSSFDTEAIQDIVGAMVVAGSGITATYDDPAGTLTVAATGGGSSTTVKRAKVTSGDLTPSLDASWAVWSAAPQITIAAAVGDYVSVEATSFMLDPTNSGTFFDWAVIVTGSIIRTMSTDTSTPAIEGSPSFYPNPSTYRGKGPVFEFVVTSGDLSSGNVTVGWIHKGSATGTLFASSNYPYRWRAINYGAVTVS